MSMTMTKPGAAPEQWFMLEGVSWDFYESLLRELADNRHVYATYDQGSLELMSPLPEHDRFSRLLGHLIFILADEANVPISSFGSTTLRREDLKRGLEPDDCYYIGTRPTVRRREHLDLISNRPPDLAIEVEITQRLLDREGIYAALGVPELWRYDGRELQFHQLQRHGQYMRIERSIAFPQLPPGGIERFLEMLDTTDDTSIGRAFRKWVQDHIK